MREVSSTSWSTLTHTNYSQWAVNMKVNLRARRLWNAIDKGTNNEEEPLGAKKTAKEAWDAIVAMCIGSDHAKKAKAQFLKQEYANIKFRDGEAVETSPSDCNHSSAI